MRLKRAVAIVLTAGVAVACAGCRLKTVSTPRNGLPSIVVQTMREEDATLRYSIRAGYPQLRSTLPAGALEKINKVITAMVLPDIAGMKQNAADDAAWAAKNPSEAVSYTHLRAHETRHDLVCRLLLEKKKKKKHKLL